MMVVFRRVSVFLLLLAVSNAFLQSPGITTRTSLSISSSIRNDPKNKQNSPLQSAPSPHQHEQEQQPQLPKPEWWKVPQRRLAELLLLTTLCLTVTMMPGVSQSANAASYGSMSDEQKVVAEAWRLVDNSFLDRTFNGQDWFQLRQQYVKKRYKTMDEAHDAIADMVATLGDKYTRYLSPSKYQSLVDSATGTLAGVGVEIATSGNTIIASDVEDNSPAQKAGIQPNDVFVEVDGQRFGAQSTPDDVALQLRGPQGSKVGVVMQRNGKQLDFIVTREPIKITSVKSYLTTSGSAAGLNGKVGVVRIKSFSATTADTVAQQVQQLQKQGAKALVMDLRGNPGGLLPGGVGTASLFLPENKPVVYVVSKTGVVDSQYTLATGLDIDTPLAVLVNGNTASAAEVFAAALQENQRAQIVGEQTFGKGVVQTIRGLSDNNGGLSITVARYETPQHHDINQQGIAVDLPTAVDCPKDNAVACLKPGAFVAPKL